MEKRDRRKTKKKPKALRRGEELRLQQRCTFRKGKSAIKGHPKKLEWDGRWG